MAVSRRELVMTAMAAPLAAGGSSVPIPLVDFGPHRVSRLIVGGNPVSGFSHVSGELSREMVDYFTAANVLKLLRDCESAGINTWQSRGDKHIRRLLHEYRLAGGRLQWIAQTASEYADIPKHIRQLPPTGRLASTITAPRPTGSGGPARLSRHTRC